MVLELALVDFGVGEQREELRNREHVSQHDEVLQLHSLISEEVPTDLPLLWESASELCLHLLVRAEACPRQP